MLVDTNVILDVLHDDPQWATWSSEQLIAASTGPMWINPIVYAGLAGGFTSRADLDARSMLLS